MPESVHRADPVYRLKAWLALAACIVLGAAVLFWLRDWLDQLYRDGGASLGMTASTGLRVIFLGLALCLIGPMLALAAWLGREERRIRAGNRYPVSGSRTLVDMPVRTGEQAQAMALHHRRLARACLLLTSGLALWAVWAWFRY